MLKIENLNAYYGQIQALFDLNIYVDKGEIVTLIGSNGAGKTSILNAISGHVKYTGDIEFEGNNLAKYKANKIAKLGLIHVPEGRHVFPGLTVEQNLIMGTIASSDNSDEQETLNRVYELFPRLKERMKQNAWSLSGGEQQMLAIGRALMGKPKVLLLDEPSMGLAPLIIDELFESIKLINTQGTTILLVEQNANRALSIADRGYVLERGRVVVEGLAEELIGNEKIVEAYLGTVGKKEK